MRLFFSELRKTCVTHDVPLANAKYLGWRSVMSRRCLATKRQTTNDNNALISIRKRKRNWAAPVKNKALPGVLGNRGSNSMPFISGEQGNKSIIQGNKGNLGNREHRKKIFFDFGKQGKMPIYFKGVGRDKGIGIPWEGLKMQL